MIEEKPLEKIIMKAGTIIKLNSIPFELESDTVVLGLKSNFKLAKKIRKSLYYPRPKPIEHPEKW